MIKVTIDLSKLEIRMLINCIDAAIETKHMNVKDAKRARDIMEKLEVYIK